MSTALVTDAVIARMIDRVTLDEDGCWLVDATRSAGYAALTVGSLRAGTRQNLRVHRLSYLYFRGEIPEGLQLDHLCRKRHCANPWHLEAVTQRENALRGVAPHIALHLRDRCKRGHSLAEFGITNGPRRRCRLCKNQRARDYRARQREAVQATEGTERP